MTASTQGDGESLADSIASTRELLLQTVRRLLPNRQDAEDVTQDALLAALLHRNGYRGDAQLTTWLYRVGRNSALMELRRQRRAVARTLRAQHTLPTDMNWLCGAAVEEPQHRLERMREAQLLRGAIAALPAHYRAVVTQCDLDERPIPKVAARLGLSSAGVRTRKLRALSLLRTWLEDHQEGI